MKLIKFFAEWCHPCKTLAQTLSKLEIEHTEVNIEENPEMALEHKIRGVPTLLILDEDGKEVSRKVGAVHENTLLEWLDQHKFA